MKIDNNKLLNDYQLKTQQIEKRQQLDAMIKKDRETAIKLLEKDLITVSKSLKPISDKLQSAVTR